MVAKLINGKIGGTVTMPVKIYFETMASGMAAKLDPKYRIRNNHAFNLGKSSGIGSSNRYLTEKFGYIGLSRKK